MNGTNRMHEDKDFLKLLPIVPGVANGQDVKVLRDTGCTAAIIRKSLVKPNQYINKKAIYVTVDQTAHPCQIAEVHI